MAPHPPSTLRLFNTSASSAPLDCPTSLAIQALTIHTLEIGYDEPNNEVTVTVNPENPAPPAPPVEEKAIVNFGMESLGPRACPTSFAIPPYETNKVDVSYDEASEEVIVTLSNTLDERVDSKVGSSSRGQS